MIAPRRRCARRALLAAGACTLGLCAGCAKTTPRTQIMLAIDAEPTVRARADALQLEVWGGGAAEQRPNELRKRKRFELDADGWPLELALVPKDGDPDRRFEVVATATEGDTTVGIVRALSGYVQGETRWLRLVLEDACIDVAETCRVDETCRDGDCMPAEIDPDTLPVFTGGDDSPPVPDGGREPERDGGSAGASAGRGGSSGRDADAGGGRAGAGGVAAEDSGPPPAGSGGAGGASACDDAQDCALPNAMTRCGALGCEVVACAPGFLECDGAPATICEHEGDACPARDLSRETKLTHAQGMSNDQYGTGVALAGNLAVIGAPIAFDAGGMYTGAAYVLSDEGDGAGFQERAELIAPGLHDAAWFGDQVALEGDVIAVGAQQFTGMLGSGSGRVFLFRAQGGVWTFQIGIEGSDVLPGDRFGRGLAISGERVIAGARYHDHGLGSLYNSGAGYVFRYDGSAWQEQDKLASLDNGGADDFGMTVDIAGELAIAGAPMNDSAYANAGAAYVFRFETDRWVQETELLADDAGSEDQLGTSVAISGELVVVGAPLTDDAGTSSGAAYVFRRSGTSWTQETRLTASDALPHQQLGSAVDVEGELIAVAAPGSEADGVSGKVYVFRHGMTGWEESAVLTASDGVPGDGFGTSLALSGGRVLVGAPLSGGGQGAAYLYGD